MKTYHTFSTVLFIMVLNCISLNAQKDDSIPSVCLNHVFIYLDSATYQNLFNSSFLSDTVGKSNSQTVKTVDDEWSGKYLNGEEGYLEFFTIKEKNVKPAGSFGLGFMTSHTGDIWKIREEWQKHTSEIIGTDTTFFKRKGTKKSWFYSIAFTPEDTDNSFPVWLMENTPEHLKDVGFNDSELKGEISWSKYYSRRKMKMKSELFPVLLKGITSVNITVGDDEWDFMKKTLTGFGLHETGNTFSNQNVKVSCDVKPYSIWRIQTITFDLNQDVPYRKLIISDNLILELEGKYATFTFK